LTFGEVVEVADDAVAAVGQGDAFDFPVVGLDLADVLSPFDGAWRVIGFAGFVGVAEAGDGFAGEGLGPDGAEDVGEVAADQGPDVAEHALRAGADGDEAEVGVDGVDAEWGVFDEVSEGFVGLAAGFLGAASLGEVVDDKEHLPLAAAVANGHGAVGDGPFRATVAPAQAGFVIADELAAHRAGDGPVVEGHDPSVGVAQLEDVLIAVDVPGHAVEGVGAVEPDAGGVDGQEPAAGVGDADADGELIDQRAHARLAVGQGPLDAFAIGDVDAGRLDFGGAAVLVEGEGAVGPEDPPRAVGRFEPVF